jgi:predicted DNA-binding transcriptional regulator AlpA
MFQVSSPSTIYRWLDEGGKNGEPDFPSPVKIMGGTAWIREEIHTYMAVIKKNRDEKLGLLPEPPTKDK